MSNNWRNWCRFCANECAIYKLDLLDKLNGIMLELFNFSMEGTKDLCGCICEDCYHFVNQIDRFKKRYEQTSNMLLELAAVSNYELHDNELQHVRCRFLDDPLPDTRNEILKRNCIGSDSDPVKMMKHEAGRERTNHMKPGKEDEDALEMSKECVNPSTTELNFEAHDEGVTYVKVKDENHDTSFVQNIEEDTFASDYDTAYNATGIQENMFESHGIDSDERNVEKSDDRQYLTCEPCNVTFHTRRDFTEHSRSNHPESKHLSFSCSKCPKKFPSRSKVKLHEAVHLPNHEKFIHPCEFCGKKFSSLGYVQVHIKSVHMKDRPFICEECGKSFATNAALREHHKAHGDESPHHCSYCPKRFKTSFCLKTHEDIHSDKYVCSVCGAQLNTRRTLKMHMLVHSDLKRFRCEYCGKQFKRDKTLKNHLILHTGLRPYRCSFCEKTFANGSNYRTHVKKAHPEELAALEASGMQLSVTKLPQLNQLRKDTVGQELSQDEK